jgi:hypothetical protein
LKTRDSDRGPPPHSAPTPLAIATTVHCTGRSRGRTRFSQVLAGRFFPVFRETGVSTTPWRGVPPAIAVTAPAPGRGRGRSAKGAGGVGGDGGGWERSMGIRRRPDIVGYFGIDALVKSPASGIILASGSSSARKPGWPDPSLPPSTDCYQVSPRLPLPLGGGGDPLSVSSPGCDIPTVLRYLGVPGEQARSGASLIGGGDEDQNRVSTEPVY